jgi:hydroxypyruvate isomerase
MPAFAANLTMLFTELPFPERFVQAKQAGFSLVEYLFPYEYPAAELKQRLDDNGLTQVLFNLPCGDWANGERGIAALPGRVEEFRAGVSQAIDYALTLGVKQINCLAGIRDPGYREQQHHDTLVGNLRYAAEALAAHGIRLLLESINHFDIPGFFVNRTAEARAILQEVNQPNVFLQYDVYHAQREEGELTATIRNHLEQIGHIQIADNPGRHQPGTGEINYPFLFQELDRLGYQGVVGLEYVPEPETVQSLAWITEYGYRL